MYYPIKLITILAYIIILFHLRLQLKQQKRKRKISRKFNSNDSTYTLDNDTDIDVFSTTTDIGDDEFYDCSDGESIVSDSDLRLVK